jgi:hypothetical protein
MDRDLKPVIIKVGVFLVAVGCTGLLYLLIGSSSTGDGTASQDDVAVYEPQQSPLTSGPTGSTSMPDEQGASSRTIPPDDPAVSCTIVVATEGDDASDGTSVASALRSPSVAVERAQPGDVVCFAPGSYASTADNLGALHIEDKHGTEAAPITFRSLDPESRAQFTMDGALNGAGVSVVFLQRSSYITLDGLEVTNGFRGVTGNGVHHVQLVNSYVHHVGGELVFFGKRAGRVKPDVSSNPSSHDILIENNEIAFAAVADAEARFGEGIYIATSEVSYRDDTHNVTIRNNRIHDTYDEAIDVKTGGYNVNITGNDIYNVGLNSQGAITLAIHGTSWNPGGYVVRDNRIAEVSRRGSEAVGIWLGHGDAVIEGNVIWNIADWGIYIPNTFNLPDARNVVLKGNVVWGTGEQSVKWGVPFGNVSVGQPSVSFDQSNRTWDGASDSTRLDTCAECSL